MSEPRSCGAVVLTPSVLCRHEGGGPDSSPRRTTGRNINGMSYCALRDFGRRRALWQRMLLRLVRVARVHLLEKHGVSVYVEPDACGALHSGLVLPAVMGCPAVLDRGELALQSIVRRRRGHGCSRQEVPRLGHGVADRRDEVPPALAGMGGGEANLILGPFPGTGDQLVLLDGCHD